MSILSLSEMPKLKELTKKHGYNIHIHDACGGQSFTLEKSGNNDDGQIHRIIEDFFKDHNMKVKFYDEDKLNFIAR